MEPADFDSQIAALEQAQANHQKEMERAAQRFLDAIVGFARDWIPTEIEQTVVGKPDVAKRVGTEGIRSLKAELVKLIESLRDFAKTDFQSPYTWPHLGPQLIRGDHRMSERIHGEGGQSMPVRLASDTLIFLGRAGGLLAKYKFVEPYSSSREKWESRGGSNRMALRTLPRLPAEVITAAREYEKLIEPLFKIHTDLLDAKRQKAEAEAKKMWDEA